MIPYVRVNHKRLIKTLSLYHGVDRPSTSSELSKIFPMKAVSISSSNRFLESMGFLKSTDVTSRRVITPLGKSIVIAVEQNNLPQIQLLWQTALKNFKPLPSILNQIQTEESMNRVEWVQKIEVVIQKINQHKTPSHVNALLWFEILKIAGYLDRKQNETYTLRLDLLQHFLNDSSVS